MDMGVDEPGQDRSVPGNPRTSGARGCVRHAAGMDNDDAVAVDLDRQPPVTTPPSPSISRAALTNPLIASVLPSGEEGPRPAC